MANADLLPVAELTVPQILDEIKAYLAEHSYMPYEDRGAVVMPSGEVYTLCLTLDEPATIDHIALLNDHRSIAFTSLAELRGWLRGSRHPG